MFTEADYQAYRDKLTRRCFREMLSQARDLWLRQTVRQIKRRWGDKALLKDTEGQEFPSIFISYAREKTLQRWIEKRLKKDLSALGFEVFFDEDDLQYGMSFAAFEQPIAEGVTFVLPINTTLYHDKYQAYFDKEGQKRVDATRSGVSDEVILIKQRLADPQQTGTVLPVLHGTHFGQLIPPFHPLYCAEMNDDNYYPIFFDLTKTLLCLNDRGAQIADDAIKQLKNLWQTFTRQRKAIDNITELEIAPILERKAQHTVVEHDEARSRVSTLLKDLSQKYLDLDRSPADTSSERSTSDGALTITSSVPTVLDFASAANAIRGGDLARLLSSSIEPLNGRDPQHNSLLHVAIRAKQPMIVQWLLRAGCDPHGANQEQFYPLHLAAYEGQAACIHVLLQQGVPLSMTGPHGRTPLHLAARGGDVASVQALLAYGAPTTVADDDGRTALHLAASRGHWGATLVLIQQGALLNATDKVGSTPLHLAIMSSQISIAQLLMSRGASLTQKDQQKQNALDLVKARGGHVTYYEKEKHQASEYQKEYWSTLAQQLKKNTAAIDVAGLWESLKDKHWKQLIQLLDTHEAQALWVGEQAQALPADVATALAEHQKKIQWYRLQRQCESGHPVSIEWYLLGSDAPQLFKQAIIEGYYSERLFEYLLHYRKMTINHTYPGQGSLLHVAVSYRRHATVIYLLNRGVDINLKTDSGYTALHIAASLGDTKMVQRLLARGIHVDARDKNQQTAQDKAERRLKEARANPEKAADCAGLDEVCRLLSTWPQQQSSWSLRRSVGAAGSSSELPMVRVPATGAPAPAARAVVTPGQSPATQRRGSAPPKRSAPTPP